MKFFSALKNLFEKEEDFNKRLQSGIKTVVDKTLSQVKETANNKLIARENELIDEYEFRLAQQKKEYEAKIIEHEVMNEQYVQMINDLQRRIESCQKAYQIYFHDSLELKRCSVEMTDQVHKTLNENGVLWKGFARIRDNVVSLTDDMMERDNQLREFLGMSSSGKLLIDRNKEK